MRGNDFNKGWKFALQDVEEAHLLNADESLFKDICLPHDYSIEQPYNRDIGDGCTGYLVGGIGWYRKKFSTTQEMQEGCTIINFDGIYNRSNIYINGKFIKFHPYGYSPCLVDITKYLNPVGEENILSVKVDHTRYADSRWYTGSGIYRKVSMHILPKVHIPVWGVYITTPVVKEDMASISKEISVRNTSEESISVEIVTELSLPSGKVIDSKTTNVYIPAHDEKLVIQQFLIKSPELWSIEQPVQYSSISSLSINHHCIQSEKTYFGIRSIEFDTNKGFFLNGKPKYIKGVCLHHEAGLVGAAVPLDVWRRRLEILKEAGCNAIRTAHNPFSEDFLDLCDQMGFLVQEEFYDEWDNPKDKRFNGKEQKVDYITRGHAEFFKDYAKEDLQNVVKRDRNHPCIIQWSIGNEIEWTYPKYNTATGYFGANANGNYFWTLPPFSKEKIKENVRKLPRDLYEIGDTARKLSTWTKALDTTRPIIANCILPSASYESGYTDALDIVGYSYRQVVYEYGHQNYPDKPIMGTENLAQWHEWKHVLEKEYIPGIFLWTGIDYIGESGNTDVWPRKAMKSGLLDVAGFKKPSYYMFKALWSNEPTLYIATQTLEKSLYELDENHILREKPGNDWRKRLWIWQDVNEHWNYKEDELTVIEIYSNCESVTLYQNEKVISTKSLKEFEDHIYKWIVPFKNGSIKAIGHMQGESVVSEIISTTTPVGIRLTVDKDMISTDLDSVAHITAQLVDASKCVVTCEERKIQFKVEGPSRYYGVDNGDVDNVQMHKEKDITTYHGRALLIIGGYEKGTISIEATIDGQEVEKLEVQVV